MKKYEGFEFNPDLNRINTVWKFLTEKTDVEQQPVDPEKPYAAPHVGFFSPKITVNDKELDFTMYIPEDFQPFGPGIMLFVPGGYTAEEYIVKFGWDKIAEKTKNCITAAYTRYPKWTDWELNEALLYAREIYLRVGMRDYCCIDEAGYYMMGFEDGAYIASVFSMLYSSLFPAGVFVNPPEIDEDLIRQIAAMPSDANHNKKKTQVPFSAWIVGENTQLVDYFRICCNASDTALSSGTYTVYQQKLTATNYSTATDEIAEVRVSSSLESVAPSYTDAVLEFIRFTNVFKWQPGVGEKYYRRFCSQEDLGMERIDAQVGEYKRYFYVYVPSKYRMTYKPEDTYPVVFGLHGVCTTGLEFANISQWTRIAEEKGIIMVYPTGYFRQFAGSMCPTSSWSYGPEDLEYFEFMVDYVKKNYPVDESRIYLTGHSNGSGMAQALLRYRPDLFCAYAPIGLTEGDAGLAEQSTPYEHTCKRPVWLWKGEYDIGCAADMSPESNNVAFLKNACALNGCSYDDARTYRNGLYETTSYYDAEHAPFVRFTNCLEMYHAFNPEMSKLIWDYFCHFRLNETGEVEYLG